MRDRLGSGLLLLVLAVLLGAAGVPTPIVAAPAMQQDENIARIDVPAAGARVSGRVEIRGRATTPDPAQFRFYRVYYGAGSAASTLRPIGSPGDSPVDDGLLATWEAATVTPGAYQLLLTVYDSTSRPIANASVVVTVEALPTPAVRPTQAPIVVVTPGEVPTPGPEGEVPTPGPEGEGPPPTPIPELPQLQPNIPQIYVPPPQPGPPIPNVGPTGSDSASAPFQPAGPGVPAATPNIPSFQPSAPAPAPENPSSAPAAPSFDPGPSSALSIDAPAPPPPPVVQPYAPPPLPTIAPPTPFGLPL